MKLKKFFIWSFIAAILGGGFLSAILVSPQKVKAETRPINCATYGGGGITGVGQAVTYRCATLSSDGYTLNMWYGDEKGPGDSQEFKFIATANYGILGAGDIGQYIYRSTSSPDFYIAVEDSIRETHHFRSGNDSQWNEFASTNRDFALVNDVKLPDFKDGIENGKRFMWRIVANGTVTLNGQPLDDTAEETAFVKIQPNKTAGPPLDEVNTGKGGAFEFSLKGINEDVWVNQKEVSTLTFYVGLEKNGKKYEAYKTVSFPADFRQHRDHDDTLVDTTIDTINLTSANEVENFTEEKGGENSLVKETVGGLLDTCGLPITKAYSTEFWIAKALCGILDMIGQLGKMIINGLFYTIFNAYHPPNNLQLSSLDLKLSSLTTGFSISQAHAATDKLEGETVSPLNQAFTNTPNKWAWVVTVWKFVLGLVDLFLVVILLFLGIVNILHIQYDTYAIKKMLPLLIIGVILANFSLLIMRMLIDASNVLTASFMGGDNPGDIVYKLIVDFGLSPGQLPAFASGWNTVGGLFLALFFSIFVIAAFFILGVMFYIRYAAILLLGIAAPLAFISLAFPPTQGLFKQWWSWTTKFVFMKPIAMFLIMIAWKAKASGAGTGIVGWMIITALVYMAIIVPFKLGGAIMGAWGGAGKWLSGTGKGGWARKPVDEWWQRRKDQAGAQAKIRFPRIFAGAEADRLKTESMKKAAQSQVQQKAWQRKDVTAWSGKERLEEQNLKDLINKQSLALEEGKLDLDWRLRLKLAGLSLQGIKPKLKSAQQFATDMFKSAAELEISTKNLEAHRKDATWGQITQIGRDNAGLTQQLDKMKDEGMHLNNFDVTDQGNLNYLTKYKLNKDGTVAKDENGQPIEEFLTYRDYLETAAQMRMKGLSSKDKKIAQNYFNSASTLEKSASEFARTHARDPNNNPINYNAFMDKNRSGRIFSVTTPWIMDEIQVNTMNENAETMPERFKKGGYGWRNNRGTHEDLVKLAQGRYSEVDPVAIAPAVAEYRTWLEFIGRKGGKDRGRFLAEFLNQVDNGEVYGPENKGKLLESVLKKENSIRKGATDEFLAEALMSAARRGLTNFGGLSFTNIGMTGQERNVKDIVDKLRAAGINSLDQIANNPEIFRQIDLTPGGGMTRAQRNLMDGISDLLEESQNFCGEGNPVGYTVKSKDRDSKDWFTDYQPANQEEIQVVTRRRQQKLEKDQQTNSQIHTLASSPPDQIIETSGGAFKAMGDYQEASVQAGRNLDQTAKDFKINNQPVDVSFFSQQLTQAIKSSVATSFQDLQNELQQKFAGLTFNFPVVDTPEEVANYKQRIIDNEQSQLNYRELIYQNDAENIQSYMSGSIKPDESAESLQQSLAKFEEAADTFKAAADEIKDNPNATIEQKAIDKMIDAISTRQQINPVSKELLSQNDEKLAHVLGTFIIGLKGALRAKTEKNSLDNQAILESIKAELKDVDESLVYLTGAEPTKIETPSPTTPGTTSTPPTPPTTPPTTPTTPSAPAGPDEDRPESIP